MGIKVPLLPRGVFPRAPPGDAALASKQYHEENLANGWRHANYDSFDEHDDVAEAEVARLVQHGHLENLGPCWDDVVARWPEAICTRLACLVKESAGVVKARGHAGEDRLPRA